MEFEEEFLKMKIASSEDFFDGRGGVREGCGEGKGELAYGNFMMEINTDLAYESQKANRNPRGFLLSPCTTLPTVVLNSFQDLLCIIIKCKIDADPP
ncbi:MAG: hypothetical protein WC806_04880 [Candidatus Gracilibacteria bacterium]